MSLTAAEAWCWVAWMLSRESDAILYAHPRADDAEERVSVLSEQRSAVYARAEKLDGSSDLWLRAMDKWGDQVSKFQPVRRAAADRLRKGWMTMTKTVKVDDVEVDAAKLLKALHDNTRALGMGALHDIGRALTLEEAAAALDDDTNDIGQRKIGARHFFSFDYYRGRPIKINASRDGRISSESARRLYDRDAGQGSFDRALKQAQE